jgi:hypothetical protein
MAPNEWLGDRERAIEDEYFWRKDRELIAKLQEKGRLEKQRRELQQQLGDVEERLLADLQAAGFSPDNLGLLHLIPLVEVAWAEGEVTPRERELVLALAARRGISPDSQGYRQLTGWLDTCPDADFFETAYQAIRAMMAQQDPDAREATEHDLIEWATRIAEATGGILGIVPACRDERECIKSISAKLTEKQRAVVNRASSQD